MNFSNLKMHLEQGQTQDSLAQRAWISVYNWVVLSTTEEMWGRRNFLPVEFLPLKRFDWDSRTNIFRRNILEDVWLLFGYSRETKSWIKRTKRKAELKINRKRTKQSLATIPGNQNCMWYQYLMTYKILVVYFFNGIKNSIDGSTINVGVSA